MKKALALLLSLLLLCSGLPLTAFAAETESMAEVGAPAQEPVGGTPVDEVALTIPAPVTGDLPSHSATYSTGVEPCYTQSVSTEIAGVYWRDVTDNSRLMSYSEHFVTGHSYRVSIKVIASDGYELHDADYYNNSVHGTVNGSTCSVSTEYSAPDEYLATTFTYTFPELDTTFIDALSLTIPQVYVDGAPRYTYNESPYVKPYTANDDFNTMQNGICWQDYTATAPLSPSGHLALGHVYDVIIQVEAKDGYLFAENLNSSDFTVNGMTAYCIFGTLDGADPKHAIMIDVRIPMTDQYVTDAGVCGDSCTWMFNSATGNLSVIGSGEMNDYLLETETPWYALRNDITDVYIQNGITQIGEYSFSNLDSVTAVRLPDTLESIESHAFEDCDLLTSVALPETLCYISPEAFYSCDSLSSVSIPAGMRFIGAEAFWECPLTAITIPDSVSDLMIGTNAFNCEFVNAVYIPSNVTGIEPGAFGHYFKNNTHYIHSGFIISGTPFSAAETYANDNGFTFINGGGTTGDCSWIYDPNTQTLTISGEGAMGNYQAYQASDVHVAPWWDFKNDPDHGVVHVVVEEGVTHIGTFAFMNCTRLTSVSLPDSLTIIDNSAFNRCAALAEIELPEHLTTIGSLAFYRCSSLTSVTIPAGVKRIDGAFERCDLASVIIDPAVSNLQLLNGAFEDNPALTQVFIPAGVTEIGDYTFGYIIVSDSPFERAKTPNFIIIGETGTAAHTYAVENGFTFCPTSGTSGDCSWSFDYPTGTLTVSGSGSMQLYATAESVPWHPFRSLIQTAVIGNGVTLIGNHAFEDCANLTAVSLPGTVTNIANSAFKGCGGLTAIGLPAGLTTIGAQAFASCGFTGLFRLPASLTSVGSGAFRDCTIGILYIPETVSGLVIGDDAFVSDTLHGAYIPAGVTQIGDHAFGYSPDGSSYQLTSGYIIFCSDDTAALQYAIDNNIFYISTHGTTGDCEWIYDVPTETLTVSGDGDMANYSASDPAPWYAFRRMIRSAVIEDGVKTVGSYSFCDAENLTSVELPETLTWIGTSAFEESGLVDLTLPANTLTVSDCAFKNCADLGFVELNDGLWEIRDEAFSGCPVEHIDLPLSLTHIGNKAFLDCSMTGVTIPPSVGFLSYSFGFTTGVDHTLQKIDSFVIRGAAGSSAETYANEHGFTFIPCFIAGTHGDCTWTYITDEDTLVISGNGDMADDLGSASAPWYSYRSEIRHLIVQNHVRHIGSYAFSCLDDLETVWLGRDIKNDGNYGSPFPYSGNIISITFAEGLTEIPTYLFYGQDNIECAVTIPDSVTRIGSRAFSRCKKLTAVDFGASLESVGDYAFSGCEKLTAAVFPDTLTLIEMHAFENCTDLQTLDLGDSCQEISHGAFEHCVNLQSLTLPDTFTTFGSDVFCGCTSITSVNIPASLVNTVNYGPFRFCSSLSTVTFEAGRTEIPSFLFSDCTGLTSITMPDTVTTIRRDAFSGCTNLQTIQIPASVTEIESYAFMCCSALQSLTIPGNLTTVKYNTFYGCTSLATVSLPNTVTTIENGAFNQCGLQHFTIPTGVTNIQSQTFQDCASLQTITFHDDVTYIGQWAFKGCTSLQTLTLPQNVTAVAYQAFADCTSLTTITLPLTLCSSGALNEPFAGCSALRNVNFPAGITKIPGYLLCGTGIEEIVIPATVTEIGSSAFSHCENLTDVTLPDGLTAIGNSAFSACTNLAEIDLPDGLTSLSSWSFGYTALTEITIPASLTQANQSWQGPFAGCDELSNVIFAPGTTQIANGLFADCPAVEEIIIPDGVTEIKSGAFRGCTALTSVTLPASVTAIGQYCFRDCTALETLTLPDGITTIPSECFYGCTALTSIDLPDSLTSIGQYAFRAAGLTAVAIPDGVTLIDNYSFYNCTALASVSLPRTLTTVGEEAFRNTALTDVAMPRSLNSIGNRAFGYVGLGSQTKTENFTVYGFADTAAQSYADYHSFSFVAVSMGDVNTDGTIDVCDVTAIQRYLVDLDALNGLQLDTADTNGDGTIDIADATYLQMYLAGYDGIELGNPPA